MFNKIDILNSRLATCVLWSFLTKKKIIYSVHVGNMTMLFQVLIIEMFLTRTELDNCVHCIKNRKVFWGEKASVKVW